MAGYEGTSQDIQKDNEDVRPTQDLLAFAAISCFASWNSKTIDCEGIQNFIKTANGTALM
jgi:hypothetical protein